MNVDKILVQGKHIQKGIEKYNGILDERIQKYVDTSPLVYTVYKFEDQRILLVYGEDLYALLYKNEEILLKELDNQFEE
jgi:hypothetical protein